MPKKKVVKKATAKPAVQKPMPAILKTPDGMTRTGANLLINPDFTAKRPGPSYRPWSPGAKKFIYLPNGKGEIKGVLENGFIYQAVKAVPGNCYELTLQVSSDQPVSMAVKWMNEKMRWTQEGLHYTVNLTPQGNNVYKAVVRVKAPSGIGAIAMLISGKGKIDLGKAELFQLK